ncbi:MAG: LptF/LptG family permease [Planctomycetota bacterium]|nr:LptF/LptG family permease [Planctomycetota bacterium]
MLRLPRTLWLSYATDLLRLLSLTAGVLVTIIAFAGAIKPISDGLLSSADALRFVLLAMPPMLAYALPFAGGFASTLVYHRIATDLEATAAYAGGLSHRAVLAPAAGVAIGCALLLSTLNEIVIPRFLMEMQRLITVDVARLVGQQVARGQSVSFGNVMIHADRVQNVRPEDGVLDALLLSGFGAVELRDGTPTTEVTSARATLWLLPGATSADSDLPASRDDEGRTRVVLELTDVVAARESGGIGVFSDTRVSWVVPNTFRDNVKFLSWRDLATIRDTPERLNWIDPKRKALALTLARVRAGEAIEAVLRDAGGVELADDRGGSVRVRAGDVTREDGRLRLAAPAGGAIEVRTTKAGGGEDAIRAAGGWLEFEDQQAALDPRVRLRLELEGVQAGAGAAARPTMAIAGLEPRESALRELLAMGSRELLNVARARGDGPDADPDLRDKMYGPHGLSGALKRLDHDVMAKRHERLALAASCAVMVLCGAVMALRLSTRSPLAVYLFSFFPALACLVTISGGQQVTVKQGAPGLILMWSGVGGLALFTFWVYRRLARH